MSSPDPSDGWTGVDVDGAGIDMYPYPAQQLMNDIAATLTNVQTTWASTNGRIAALEGKLGNGPLGRPVAAQYNPTAEQIREFMTEMLERLEKLSDAGTKAVPIYVNADIQAGHRFEF